MASSGSGEAEWLQGGGEDQTDALPQTLRFNWFDILCILCSILTYLLDLGMDAYMAYVYYASGYVLYFALSLLFILIPSVSMTAFSLRWYVIDMDNQTIPRPSCAKWVVRTGFLLLQVAPVLRYFDALVYGLKSREAGKRGDRMAQLKYYAYMANEDADSTLIRLFEAFMESAPQVTLQLYILIYHFNDKDSPFAVAGYEVQLFSILSSLVSLAWSLAVYHRSLRYPQQDKTNISYSGTLFQFLWHLCSISARVFALGVFAATYPLLIFPVCVAHWCAMLAWLIVQKSRVCETQCEEALFNLIVAFIYIYTFFNVREEPTRYKYVTFYVITFVENTVLLLTWFFSFNLTTQDILYFRISGLVGNYALFFAGILCMVLYYVYFHPTVGSMSRSALKAPSIASFPVDVTKSKALSRKGSIDTTQLGVAINSQAASSGSRRFPNHPASSSNDGFVSSSSQSIIGQKTNGKGDSYRVNDETRL